MEWSLDRFVAWIAKTWPFEPVGALGIATAALRGLGGLLKQSMSWKSLKTTA